MRRVAIELEDEYFDALERLAKYDRRSIRSYTAIMVENTLRELGAVKAVKAQQTHVIHKTVPAAEEMFMQSVPERTPDPFDHR